MISPIWMRTTSFQKMIEGNSLKKAAAGFWGGGHYSKDEKLIVEGVDCAFV